MVSHKKTLASRIKLSNGSAIPQVQLGLYMLSGEKLQATVRWALDTGYRAFDCAQWYYNEAEAGRAIQAYLTDSERHRQPLKREDIFYTTKLANNTTNYHAARRSISKSVQASGLGYVDLFLLHSPLGGRKARLASWRALEDAIAAGEVRMGGVSNFGVSHVEELMRSDLRIHPVTNQIEVHPFNTQRSIREVCAKYSIQVVAYSPLVKGMHINHPTITAMAAKHSCTPAQVLIRWSVQHNFVTLPKSSSLERLIENGSIDDMQLSASDVEELDNLDEHLVTDWDPTGIE